MTMEGGNRIVAFDYLRILAAYTVVVLHVVSNPFVSTFPSFEWNVANFYESLVRWNVPIFVMISGALFLNRKLDITKLWTKNILRILIVFIFWSAIYEIPLVGNAHNIYSIIAGIAHGPGHFWYLKMLLGLYIAIPVYKYIVTNKDVEGYFLILTFIVGILIPSCLSVVSLVNVSAKEFLQELLNSVSGNMVSTYSFYFVLGHYLTNYKMNRNIVIYILGIISCLSCFLFTFNFHYFKPSVAFYLPVLIYKRTILYKMEGEIVLEAPIKTGMLHLGGHGLAIQDKKYSRTIWSCSGTLIIKGERNHVGHGSKICIDKEGILTIGGNLMITGNSEIVCSNNVQFGKNCLLSWEILVMDNDHHRIINSIGDVINSPKPIIIGDHVWIGCRSTILKGVTIADNNVIASNSVVTRDIMDNNCIIGGVGRSMGVIKRDVDWLI